MNWSTMKWYDAADDQAANEEAAKAEGRQPPPPPQPGLVYRLDDGTPVGRWRVCVEDVTMPPEKRTWAIYDLRRLGMPRQAMSAVKVAGGFPSHQRAILVAQVLAWSGATRMVLAAWRSLGRSVLTLLDERDISRQVAEAEAEVERC